MTDVSGIPNMGFSWGGMGPVIGGIPNVAPAMSADQINKSMWGTYSPQQQQADWYGMTGNLTQDPATYAGIGAAYNLAIGGGFRGDYAGAPGGGYVDPWTGAASNPTPAPAPSGAPTRVPISASVFDIGAQPVPYATAGPWGGVGGSTGPYSPYPSWAPSPAPVPQQPAPYSPPPMAAAPPFANYPGISDMLRGVSPTSTGTGVVGSPSASPDFGGVSSYPPTGMAPAPAPYLPQQSMQNAPASDFAGRWRGSPYNALEAVQQFHGVGTGVPPDSPYSVPPSPAPAMGELFEPKLPQDAWQTGGGMSRLPSMQKLLGYEPQQFAPQSQMPLQPETAPQPTQPSQPPSIPAGGGFSPWTMQNWSNYSPPASGVMGRIGAGADAYGNPMFNNIAPAYAAAATPTGGGLGVGGLGMTGSGGWPGSYELRR